MNSYIKTYKPPKTVFCLLAGLMLTFGLLSAQELSNIGKSPVLSMNGGISLNQIFFQSDDSLSRRDPYTYTLNANLNLALYGWSVPVSAVYSNKKWEYHQPFNQLSLHPSYKWIKLHVGNVSMNFSPYTLSGHQFLGGGAELSPGNKFRFSAMGGRLQKSILPDSASRAEPMYERYGTGFKTEYNLGPGNIALILFYARDNEKSLPFTTDSLPVSPKENLTAGLSGNFTLLKKLSLTFDYSSSTLTDNTFSDPLTESTAGFPGFNYRQSTSHFNALKSAVSYNSPVGSIGLGFERVDPGYRTLGAYYTNNNFVNYTINYAGSMLKNRVNFGISYGLQEDNLSGEMDQDTKRTVANVNLGLAPVKNVNIAFFYSNFNNYTHIRNSFEDINSTDPYDNLDTLDFTQISESLGGSVNLNLGNKEKITHNVSLTANFQQATQQQEDTPELSGSAFFNAGAGYNMRISKAELSPGLMFNYSNSGPDTLKNEIFGPSFSLRKNFLNKTLNTQLMVSYNLAMLNQEKNGENTILRLTSGYKLNKKHNFNLSYVMAFRRSNTVASRNEMTITLTYRYTFGWSPFGDEKKKTTQDAKTSE